MDDVDQSTADKFYQKEKLCPYEIRLIHEVQKDDTHRRLQFAKC